MLEQEPSSSARDGLAVCRFCGHETINTHDRVCAVCAEALTSAATLPPSDDEVTW